jgi:beta-phosphoglucomutase-like phosphatase (HAD superfamily)
MPGAAELVAEVEAAGLPYALVTSSQRRFVDAVLSRIGLRFPVVVSANDVTRGKPDPEPYLLAARRLGADPGRCVVLEDSITGVTAAEAAGCLVVAVPTLRTIEPRPGRLVVRSLSDISLGWLRAAWDGHPGLGAALAGASLSRPTDPLYWPPLAVVFSATAGAPASASGSRSGKWHAAR